MRCVLSSMLMLAAALPAAEPMPTPAQPTPPPSDRVDGRFWTQIRPERLVTPCTPFAKDYVRPPKILFLIPGMLGSREVSELHQRFAFTFDAVLFQGSWIGDELGQSNMYTGAIAGVKQAEKLAELLRLLRSNTYDAIVFGHNGNFTALSPRAQFEVLQQVEKGAGLVMLHPQADPAGKKFPAQLATGPQPLAAAQILAGVPVGLLPCYAATAETPASLGKLARATQLGKGRVVWLSTQGFGDGDVNIGVQALTPWTPYAAGEEVRYDQYLSAVAKTILSAIPAKAPTVVADPANQSVVELPFAAVPGQVTVGSFTSPVALTAYCSVVNLLGDRVQLPPQQLAAGTSTLTCTLPALAAGEQFVEYRLASKAGTEWWGALGVRVQNGPASFEPWADADKPWRLERVADGLAITARIAGQAAGCEVRYRGTELSGQVIFQGTVAVTGAEIKATAPLNLASGLSHRLRLELWQGKRCLSLIERDFFVQQPLPEFINLLWGGSIPSLLTTTKTAQLRRAGFNTFLSGGAATQSAEQVRAGAHAMDYCFRVQIDAPPEKQLDVTFADPAYLKTRMEETTSGPGKAASPYKDFIDIYSLGDECSYTYSRPRVAPLELAAFRAFVRTTYGNDLALLNREWQTKLTSFDEVTVPDVDNPLGISEVPRKHLWMRFVEQLYADVYHQIAANIRAKDPAPGKLIGAEGSMMGDPELTLEGLTMWGPYPSRLDNAMMRSFGSPELLRGNWWGGYLAQRAAGGQPLWAQVLSGGVNASFYFQDLGGEGVLSQDLSFTDFFEKEQWPVMLEVNAGVGPLLAKLPTANLGLGVLYSRSSEHALTIDGRIGSPGSTRDGLLAWSEELGIPAFLCSPTQIEAGKLTTDNMRILFMPQVTCLDESTVQALQRWVEAGGTLVADLQPGFRNGRGAPRTSAVADALFGVTHQLTSKPADSAVTIAIDGKDLVLERMLSDPAVQPAGAVAQGKLANGTPILFSRTVGKGRTLLLNFSLGKALTNNGEKPELRQFMRGLLDQAGVADDLRVATGLRVHRFSCGAVQLLGCQGDGTGKDGLALTFPKPRWVYDVRAGKSLGQVDHVVPSEHGGRNNLFVVSEKPLAGFTATSASKLMAGTLADVVLTPTPKAGELVNRRLYRLALFRPDGQEDVAVRRFAWAEEKPLHVSMPLAFNLVPGAYRLVATDLLSGAQQTISFNNEAKP